MLVSDVTLSGTTGCRYSTETLAKRKPLWLWLKFETYCIISVELCGHHILFGIRRTSIWTCVQQCALTLFLPSVYCACLLVCSAHRTNIICIVRHRGFLMNLIFLYNYLIYAWNSLQTQIENKTQFTILKIYPSI